MNRPSVTVEQLLELGAIPGYRVIGGRAGLTRRVARVFPCTDVHHLSAMEPDTLIVFPQGAVELSSMAMDLAIRLARSARAAGIVTRTSNRPTAAATELLADALAIPLIVVNASELEHIIANCDPYVRAPEIAALKVLGDAVEQFLVPPGSAAELIDKLRRVLNLPVALIDSEGGLVAGDEEARLRATAVAGRAAMSAMRPHGGIFTSEGHAVVMLHPTQTERGAPANLWLIAVSHTLPERLQRPILHALGVAAMAYAGHVAAHAAKIEREGRYRSMLLSELLESDELSASTLEKTSALRWPLGGWHTVVYLAWRGEATIPERRLLAAALERNSTPPLACTVVEQADGFVFWKTSDATELDPPSANGAEFSEAVRELLRSVDPTDERGLCAGIGSPEFGVSGIRRSLSAARKAAMLAQNRTDPYPVEHASTVTAAGLLAGWFHNQTLQEVASEILARLLAADPNQDLLRTLRCYLDHESSATSAAEQLGVHRNTVILRLERIKGLLDLDLANADDRLVIQLATRSVNPNGGFHA